jgi:biotin transport system substrate-specific component
MTTKTIGTTKTLTRMALMLALIIVGGAFALPVPAIGVPVVLQNMVIMLAGGLLGKKRGSLTVLVFLGLVATGLPLLSGGRGGAALFVGPSAGFLLGFLLCPLIEGLLFQGIGQQHYWQIWLVYWLGGALLINFCGSFSLALVSHVSWWSGLKMAAFYLPMDTAKVVVAALIHQRLQRQGVLR